MPIQLPPETAALIEDLIAREWAFFDQVHALGGRASCQDDHTTFYIMRCSQFLTWDRSVLESYGEDLRAAESAGRNPIAEKYGYMMQWTDPAYFRANLAGRLPEISAAKLAAVEEIAARYARWHQSAKALYPAFVGRGRPETGVDSETTSSDVYLRGELLTYSEKTLLLLREMTAARAAAGRNPIVEIFEHTAQFYGFDSLRAAEDSLSGR